MPQNQRLASGFASVKAEMSSSSPGRIAVPSATMSRPAGSKMKPEDARPTQVACVQSTRRWRRGAAFFLTRGRLPRGSACNLLHIEAATAHREPLGCPPRRGEGRGAGDEG